MNRNSVQILRGASSYDPKASEEVILDGQLFYSKKTKKLYIGDGSTKLCDLEGTKIGLNNPVYITDSSTEGLPKAVYEDGDQVKMIDISMLSTEQIYTSADSINLEVGQTFNNQEAVIYLNWSGENIPHGSIYIDGNTFAGWSFATNDPWIIINGTTYYQSQGITEVVVTLNGTITNIDSDGYDENGPIYGIPPSSVFSIEAKSSVVTDLLVRTEDGKFGCVDKKELLREEKIIHITEYTAQNIISFSMQGYSHFQMIHAKGSMGSELEEQWGPPIEKNENFFYITYWSMMGDSTIRSGLYCSVTYDSSNDMVSVLFNKALYMDGADLSVYIRLFNAEEV